jgi:hypothetical protein
MATNDSSNIIFLILSISVKNKLVPDSFIDTYIENHLIFHLLVNL